MKLLHETMTNFLVFTSYKVFFLDSLPRIEARQVEELRAFEAYIAISSSMELIEKPLST